ncbi:MAG: HDIG domain-containing protein, partial [Candidatus Dadabacteria bacterium]
MEHSDKRKRAFALLQEYTKSESLIKHALCVEAAMRWYADYFNCGRDEMEKWGITGLLHDFDYEKYPDPDNGPCNGKGHPYAGCEILREQGYDEEIIEAIMGHALYTGVERKTLMAKTLFAVDELTGLVVASTLVRPDRSLHTLTSKSVKKKMK